MKITNYGPCEYRGTTDKKLEGTQGMELLIIGVDETVEIVDIVAQSLINKFSKSTLHRIDVPGKKKAETQQPDATGKQEPPKIPDNTAKKDK